MGERLPCTQEAIGSNPFISTIVFIKFLFEGNLLKIINLHGRGTRLKVFVYTGSFSEWGATPCRSLKNEYWVDDDVFSQMYIIVVGILLVKDEVSLRHL